MLVSKLGLFSKVGIFLALSLNASTTFAASDVDPNVVPTHEQTLLQVSTDTMGGSTLIKLNLDENSNVLSLREYTADGTVKEFSLDQLAFGAELMNSGSHHVITLIFKDLDVHSGGDVNMVYLSNGILNTHSNFRMNLTHPPTGWTLEVDDQAGRRAISKMLIKGKKFFGQVIGVSEIIVN